jgi:hypothetical protein
MTAHTITLSEGDRVAATWEMQKTGPVFSGDFTATALLQLHYENGALYLKDPNYNDVQFAILEEGADAEGIASRDLADVVLQGFGGPVVRNDALKEILGDILGAILNAFPIFDLRSLDGNLPLVALVLEDVSVSDGPITATFSLKMLISQCGAVVLFLLVMLLYVGRTAPIGRNT